MRPVSLSHDLISPIQQDFISSFTGSAGTALITRTQALLWTDGRYHNQASKELSSDWTLMRSGVNGVPTLTQWLVENISAGKTVGVDPSLISAAAAHDLISAGVSLVPIGEEFDEDSRLMIFRGESCG